eukprot:c20994_g1_i1.p1 GENE.c20994_g1_i1~~c20994_g1_i1.p1  ORF type:complete len:719 (+),score=105.47 c20994_g1_i1:56-2212(+)
MKVLAVTFLVLIGLSQSEHLDDGTRFLALGPNALLQYTWPEGAFSIWEVEPAAIGKCNPFPRLPHTTGLMTGVDIMTNLGAEKIFSYNLEASTFELVTCQVVRNATATNAFRCSSTISGSLAIFDSGLYDAITAVHPGKLVTYSSKSGQFIVYALSTKNLDDNGLPDDCDVAGNCGFEAKQLVTGNFADHCSKSADGKAANPYTVVGLDKDEFLVNCKDSDDSVSLKLVPKDVGDEPNYFLEVVRKFTMPHHDYVIQLQTKNMILGYDMQTLKFEISECDSFACTSLHTGSFIQGPTCAHPTIDKCINDTRCGYCVDTGKCQERSGSGPCYGQCVKWLSKSNEKGASIRRLERTAHVAQEQLVSIGTATLFHFVASEGTYKMYDVALNHPSHGARCPGLSSSPVFSGSLPIPNTIASSFSENSILFHDPASGEFNLWSCSRLETTPRIGIQAAPCSFVTGGQFDGFLNASAIIRVGRLTLSLFSDDGQIRIYDERDTTRRIEELKDDIFIPEPTFIIDLPQLKSHKLISIGRNQLLELNPTTGAYSTWFFDATRGTLIGPAAEGTLPVEMSHSLTWLGDDRLLALDSQTTEYLLVRFDEQLVGRGSPLGLTTIGRGNLRAVTCDYSTCSKCIEDSECGWCGALNRCLPGNSMEPCSAAAKCKSWMFGYCAAEACPNLLTSTECVAVANCGWCEKTAQCIPQKNGLALHNDCIGNLVVQ